MFCATRARVQTGQRKKTQERDRTKRYNAKHQLTARVGIPTNFSQASTMNIAGTKKGDHQEAQMVGTHTQIRTRNTDKA